MAAQFAIKWFPNSIDRGAQFVFDRSNLIHQFWLQNSIHSSNDFRFHSLSFAKNHLSSKTLSASLWWIFSCLTAIQNAKVFFLAVLTVLKSIISSKSNISEFFSIANLSKAIKIWTFLEKYGLPSSETFTNIVLLLHLITLAYSLSTQTEYQFSANNWANNSHAVFIPDPAGPENAIFRCIIQR